MSSINGSWYKLIMKHGIIQYKAVIVNDALHNVCIHKYQPEVDDCADPKVTNLPQWLRLFVFGFYLAFEQA